MSNPGTPMQLSLDLRGGRSAQSVHTRRRRPKGLERCESQLERQLVLALAGTGDFRPRRHGEHPWHVGTWESYSLALLAQPAIGPYRADLAIVPAAWRPSERVTVVVEVDGHEFHERTAEQAERDRSRDRYMATRGTTVLRFTGREVWRDARACAHEVMGYLSKASIKSAELEQA